MSVFRDPITNERIETRKIMEDANSRVAFQEKDGSISIFFNAPDLAVLEAGAEYLIHLKQDGLTTFERVERLTHAISL